MQLIKKSLLFLTYSIALMGIISLHALDEEDSGLRVAAVIGSKEFVLLSRTLLYSDLFPGEGAGKVGTTGSGEVYIGMIELSLYSNYSPQTGASTYFKIYEYEYDTANSIFSIVNIVTMTDRIAIDIKSNQSLTGATQQPTTVGTSNPSTIRQSLTNASSIDNIIQISFWAKDHSGNSVRSGTYTGSFVFYFTD